MNSSPYLQAIQDVAGTTPGQKYRTLNDIARRIIKESNVQDKTVQAKSSLELPDILVPFVNLEIAKIVRDPDRIVEALKSDDITIFNRALRTKWFFDGTVETVTNVTYFQDHIFQWVSVSNRIQLIKTLSVNLAPNKKTYIAEEFYSALSDMYGSSQPEPLLYACSETFIWHEIMTRQLVPSVRTVERLFYKYPNVVVEYLKLSVLSKKPYDRNLHKIPIKNYVSVLPRLMKNYVDIFVEVINSYGVPPMKLSRKCTERFLKKRIDAVIENSRVFGASINLRLVSSKLTTEQFELFFCNMFPIKTPEITFCFPFMEMYEYLKYYPSSNRVPLILSTFEKVYEKKFLDCDDLLTPEVLRLLSPADREFAARKKIKKDTDWTLYYSNPEYSWRCYLPIRESIPILKDRISRTPEVNRRRRLIEQMIYACKVNNDEEALLDLLRYIIIRHKNERGDTLLSIIRRLMQDFEIEKLSEEHWNILNELINMMHVKDQLQLMTYVTCDLIHAKIHYNLIHSIPITGTIKFLYDFMKNDYTPNWNILTDHPVHERKCLMEFLEVVPPIYAQEKSVMELVNSFLTSINNFNERIQKTESGVKPIAIDNQWLLEQIPLFVNSDEADDLRLNLKKCDLKLYNAWVTNKKNEKMIDLRSSKEYNEWKKNPERIAENWEMYLQECENEIHTKYAQRFIKVCRWHQNIPIKFTGKCLEDISENRNPSALIVLSLLLEGPVFENLISRFSPTESTIDIVAEDAKEQYLIIQSIVKTLSNVNPQVSLNVTAQLCKGDTIHITANWLKMLSRRTSIAKLLPFVKTFFNRPVSVSKHFIRIFSTAANITECHRAYMNLWRSEKHQTIRTLVFDRIYHLFVRNPNNETWLLITECLDNLTIADKESLKSMCRLEDIPNKYIADYSRKILMILGKSYCAVDSMDQEFIESRIVELLKLPDNVAFLFPEELHKEILMTYFTDLSWSPEIASAAQYYLINAYINPALDKLESRLTFYSNMFMDILKNQWDVPDSRRANVFPLNYMVDSQMITTPYYIKDDATKQKFINITLKSFVAILNPLQAPSFFSCYVFASLHHINMSREDYANRVIETIPTLIATFGVESISVLGASLAECLKLLCESYIVRYEATLDIIESLLSSKNELGILLASAIPIEGEDMYKDDRYIHILQKFRQQKNPAVIASASTRINRCGFQYT